MDANERETIVGVFEDRTAAIRAVSDLRAAGFTDREIGVIARRGETEVHTGPADEPPGTGSMWDTGAATGAAAGAGIGILWALGIAAGILPGIGPVVAGGILGSVLASAAGGAVVGGILGALIGLGVPEDEARYYESEVHSGRTLVAVRASDRNPEAWMILLRHGAYNIHTERHPTSPPAGNVGAPAENINVPISGSPTSPPAHR
jgi:hypothetical protein